MESTGENFATPKIAAGRGGQLVVRKYCLWLCLPHTHNRRRPGFDHSPPIQSASQEFLFLCSLNHTNARRKSKSGRRRRVGEPIWDESRNYCSIVRFITRDLVKRNQKRVRRNFERILSWFLTALCVLRSCLHADMKNHKIIPSDDGIGMEVKEKGKRRVYLTLPNQLFTCSLHRLSLHTPSKNLSRARRKEHKQFFMLRWWCTFTSTSRPASTHHDSLWNLFWPGEVLCASTVWRGVCANDCRNSNAWESGGAFA